MADTQGHATQTNQRAYEQGQGTTEQMNQQPQKQSRDKSAQNQSGSGQSLERRHSSMDYPMTMMRQMIDDMDRLSEALGFPTMRGFGFPSFFDLAPRDRQQGQQSLWSPQVEVLEKDNQLVVRADLPGVNKDDVTIEVDDNILTLRGERKNEHEEKQGNVYRSERSYGSFQRSFRLPEGTNPDEVTASFQNGVLEITMPNAQSQQAQPRRIEVR